MMQSWKTCLLAVVLPAFLAGEACAYDQEQAPREPNANEMFVDAVYGKPLGLVGLIMGATAFVISLPFTLTSHSTGAAAKTLIGDPVKYTFKRPLGRFISCDEQPEICK